MLDNKSSYALSTLTHFIMYFKEFINNKWGITKILYACSVVYPDDTTLFRVVKSDLERVRKNPNILKPAYGKAETMFNKLYI